MSLDKAQAAANIFAILEQAYDRYAARKRQREVEDRDRKIKELEKRIVKPEAPKP